MENIPPSPEGSALFSSKVVADSTDSVVVTYRGNSASYSNDLYLMLDSDGRPGDDGNTSNDRFIFNNHGNSVGSTINLGSFQIGTELIFRMHVNNTGYDYFTGPANRNPDNHAHATVEVGWSATEALVSFEDLFNGAFNYNDLSYSFTNVLSQVGPPTGSVIINGTVRQGNTLIVTNDLADPDGIGTINYQWKANNINIANAITNASYQLAQAEVGKLITVTASYIDGHGMAESVTSAATAAVANINDAPTGANKTVILPEDGSYIIASADFGFADSNDSPANALKTIKITTLPAPGTLRLNGAAVTAGQSINAADIGTNKLMFTPAANGNSYASFTFQVQDDGGTTNSGVDIDQSPNTLRFNVTAVNDAPTAIQLPSANVNENSANGTVIGQLVTIDPDNGDSFSYQLLDNAGGRFAVVGNQLQVANGGLLDFESNTSHSLRVRSTDAGGLSVEQNLTVNLTNIDADLTVGTLTLTSPLTQVRAGTAFDLSWTLVNQSTEAYNGNWMDRIYMDDSNTAGLDYLIGSFPIDMLLNPNATITRTQTLAIPVNAQGSYKLVVVTDANNDLNEGADGEANNSKTSAASFSVTPIPTPNLQVGSITSPASAFTRHSIDVQWTVTNAGTAPTSTPVWNDALYLSTDATLDSADTYLGSAVNPSYLDVWQTYTNSVTVALPKVEGNYHILVVADKAGQVDESRLENDNVRAGSTLTIQAIPIAQQSDLAVMSVAASHEAFSGQRINLTYTIDNAGPVPIAGGFDYPEWVEQIYMSADNVLDANDTLLQTINRDLYYQIIVWVNLPMPIYANVISGYVK